MGLLLGIDLGTSSVRTMLMRPDGRRLGVQARRLEVIIPAVGRAEQEPQRWYEATADAIRSVLAEAHARPGEVGALAISGQMHGLVCLDQNGRAMRPAIIWQDIRAARGVQAIHERLGREFLRRHTQNVLSPGFLAASLAWIADCEPESFAQICHVMLPKDYVRYRLTGKINTDYSDAAGTGAFDNVSHGWSGAVLEALGFPPELFPPAYPSTTVVGHVSAIAAADTGLRAGTPVVNGGADQCMQGIGSGIVATGDFSVNVGTGGQIATAAASPTCDSEARTNTLAHVLPKRWNIMGATLSAGASLKWLSQRVLGGPDFATLDEMAATVPPGSDGLVFLPYLGGERTPLLDPAAAGVFFGLRAKHGVGHLARAVMEGVAYSLRRCFDVITRDMGLPCDRLIASGGGARSALWTQIQADVLGTELFRSHESEQACLGAAMTAGVATGVYANFAEAADAVVVIETRPVRPQVANRDVYEEYLELFDDLYRANRDLFKRIPRAGTASTPAPREEVAL